MSGPRTVLNSPHEGFPLPFFYLSEFDIKPAIIIVGYLPFHHPAHLNVSGEAL